MKHWDPHFHLWDVSPGTASGHDPERLAAVDGNPVYDRACYESDLRVEGFELTGGALVEAVSVCHVETDGPRFATACIAEARWVAAELATSPLDYVVVASAPLEDPDLPAILAELRGCRGLRGIRQIVNHEPSWPRNARRGDFLDLPAWNRGFARLEAHALSFDLQLNPHQFRRAARLLERHPGIPIVIDHLGSPTLEDLREGSVYWDGMEALADLEQTHLKVSMLCYTDPNWDRNPLVREAALRAIDLFGARRCMFASNFPADKLAGWTSGRLYTGFRELASHFGEEERRHLFGESARRAYRATE